VARLVASISRFLALEVLDSRRLGGRG
jgi:hypothetical protein